MPSTPSTRLRVELMAAGENLNTWGNPKLTSALQRLEEGSHGRLALTLSGPVTLTAANYVADQARMMFLDCTGTGGTITIPGVEKVYLVRNATSGNALVTTGSGLVATIVPGDLAHVVSDGVNCYASRAYDFGGNKLTNLGTPALATDAATKGYVDATAFAPVLPGQAGNSGKFVTTNGVSASWASLTVPSVPPQGRLTLTTGVPVTNADVTGATAHFYTPWLGGRYVSLWNGAIFVAIDVGGELTQATTDTTKSPAAVAASSNYDVFVWLDGSTFRATRGPLWTSDTARGTGAGTSQLSMVQGVLVNTVAITNGPAAGFGTYVGTVRSDGSSQLRDTKADRWCWNMYNRRPRGLLRVESTASWTYGTATYRQANAAVANKVTYVCGVAEDLVAVALATYTQDDGGNNTLINDIGVDSLTAAGSTVRLNPTGGNSVSTGARCEYNDVPGLGYHYLAWLEKASTAAASVANYGTNTIGNYPILSGLNGVCHA